MLRVCIDTCAGHGVGGSLGTTCKSCLQQRALSQRSWVRRGLRMAPGDQAQHSVVPGAAPAAFSASESHLPASTQGRPHAGRPLTLLQSRVRTNASAKPWTGLGLQAPQETASPKLVPRTPARGAAQGGPHETHRPFLFLKEETGGYLTAVFRKLTRFLSPLTCVRAHGRPAPGTEQVHTCATPSCAGLCVSTTKGRRCLGRHGTPAMMSSAPRRDGG